MHNRKGLALAIMSKIPSKGKDDKGSDYDKEDKDEDESMGVESAAKSVRKAIESRDDKALAEALKDFIDIC